MKATVTNHDERLYGGLMNTAKGQWWGPGAGVMWAQPTSEMMNPQTMRRVWGISFAVFGCLARHKLVGCRSHFFWG